MVHRTSRRVVRRAVVGGLVAAMLLSSTAACSSDDAEPTAEATAAPSVDPTASVVDGLISTGIQQLSEQATGEAKKSFQAAIAIDPANLLANYNLGFIAQTAGDDAAAITFYTTALAADSSFAPALYNLAILTEASDLSAAVELYRQVLVTKPDDAGTLLRLGDALQRLGQKVEGQEYIDRGNAALASPSPS